MKILIVTSQYPPLIGGIPSFVFNLVKNWPDNNSDLVVYTNKHKLAKEVDVLQPWKVYRHSLRKLIMLWYLWRICRTEKIDLIHLHNTHELSYLSSFLLTKIIKKPYRLFLHSADFNYLKNKKLGKKKIHGLVQKAWQIVVNSQYLKNEFNNFFEDFGGKILVVYPAPGEHFFNPTNENELVKLRKTLALEGKKIIITVARLAEGKGYPRLIHLLPKVLEKVPNLVWLIIGDGPKRPLFMNLIQKNYLQNIIRYIGQVEHNHLLKYYHLADLFVLLTHPDQEAEEDWGTVFVEASASGLPILAGQVGGIEESVQNLKTGIIVDINQEKAVVNSMVELLNNKEYAVKMGQTGREWVKNNINWSDQLAKLLN